MEQVKKAGSPWESNKGLLCMALAASALPQSYDNWTTTSPHNPLYVLRRWDWNASVAHLAANLYVLSELC